MAEEREVAGIAGDAAAALCDAGFALLDGVSEISAAIESVDAMGQRVAGVEVGGRGGPDFASGYGKRPRRALDAAERLADVESQAGIERERAVVEGGLDESDAGGLLFVSPLDHVMHETAADSGVLH